FTIFGYLDTAYDTQFVRVIPFRRDIGGTESEELDAVVTSTELESSTVHEWQDSVITFEDGSIGHVFSAPFRPIPGRTYRFMVELSDRAVGWAETEVPIA